MNDQNRKNHPTSKSCFLERFSGKLNVITKEGQIKEDNFIKFPIIILPESRKSSKMKLHTSKQFSHSFFTDNRSLNCNSSIIRHRAQKFLTQNYDKELSDISNIGQINKHKQLKKSSIKRKNTEPLSAIPFTKKFKSARENTSQDYGQKDTVFHMAGSKVHKTDCINFLKELDMIGNSFIEKRRAQRVFDKENIKR